MSSAPPKVMETYPALGFLAVARAALGCGIGMMMANRFQRTSTRKTTAIALLSLGVLGNVPSIVTLLMRLINRPGSERMVRKRLASIREGVAMQGEELF